MGTRIVGGNYVKRTGDDMSGPLSVTDLTTPPGFNMQITPGAGGIVQIGDAGAQSHGLVNNDDLFVSGKLEVEGNFYVDGNAYLQNALSVYQTITQFGVYSAALGNGRTSELLTIPVGQGAAGVVTAANLAPANSTIVGVQARVTQAPGGGATTIDIGRTGGGNLDEFIDGIATALGTTGTFAANHDAATVGPVLNAADDTLTLTTNANVLVTDMKVRINIFYRIETPPTA